MADAILPPYAWLTQPRLPGGTIEYFDPSEAVQTIHMFGCTVQSVNAQFGLNQNPTVYTFSVVKDVGETFELDAMTNKGMRSPVHVQIGELDMRGVVAGWEKTAISIQGQDIFEVRVADSRMVLQAAQMLIGASVTNEYEHAPIDYGPNVIPIVVAANEDFSRGVRISQISAALNVATIHYGDVNYTIQVTFPSSLKVFDDVPMPEEYRVRGAAMNIVELIQQVCTDNGWEWWVETDSDNQIIVHIINRLGRYSPAADINLNVMAQTHAGKVIRKTYGYENREEINTNVVVGAPVQRLERVEGSRFKQFWGFDDDGHIFDGPTVTFKHKRGTPRVVSLSGDNVNEAMNAGLDEEEWTEEERTAIQSYVQEYAGRRFYATLLPVHIDANGESYREVVSAGIWEGGGTPENLSGDAALKFCTDDGRWRCFVRLPDPVGEWNEMLWASSNVYVNSTGTYFLGAQLERYDTTLVLTLDEPMSVFTIERVWVEDNQATGGTFPGFVGGSTPWEVLSGPQSLTLKDTGGTGSEGHWENKKVEARLGRFDRLYMPILDKLHSYGPWSNNTDGTSGEVIGQTRVDIDTTLSPWTFGFRSMSTRVAFARLNAVGTMKVQARTDRIAADTGQLEVADMPKFNLGVEIGRAANITGIMVTYSVQGIRTTYRSNLFTNEFGKMLRRYQNFVDAMMRDAKRRNNTQYPQTNYPILDAELKTIRQQPNSSVMGNSAAEATVTSAAAVGGMGRIDAIESGPFYTITRLMMQSMGGSVSVAEDWGELPWTGVRNLAEPDDSPGLLAVGTRVTVKIFAEGPRGPYTPYIEQTPNLFAPPIA